MVATPSAIRPLEFGPPPAPGIWQSLGLALLAHALLVAALTWGVAWRRHTDLAVPSVELWARLPQEAAPRPAEPPPAPVLQPEPPKPMPQPVESPDIATERAKQKAEDERRRKDEKAERDKAEKAAVQKQKEAAEAKLKADREANIARALASAGGATTSAGTAPQSAGPSASYAGRIRARIKPNIVFTDTVTGNPMAEVEVRTSPDGTIVGKKLLKSSGVPAWDEAVLKAIEKTEVLPRDTDGRVPPLLEIGFRPKD